jgi:hypothetical protein
MTISANDGGAYLTIGQEQQESSSYEATILINNGLNPAGITDKLIIYSKTTARNKFTFFSDIYANDDIWLNGQSINACRYTDDIESISEATKHRIWMFYDDREEYIGYANDNLVFRLVGVDTRANKTYFRFYPNVYFTYEEANDYIYASKTIQQASDEKLKNIAPYDDKYDDLLDVLEPILYTWKSHPEGARYVGLGARKTAKLLEEVGIEQSGFVGINQDEDGNEIYSIDYNELSTMLLHKVQKQEKRIKELETTLNDVLERLKRLEA